MAIVWIGKTEMYKMNIANNYYLKISLGVLVSFGALYSQSLHAAEWLSGADEKTGFSEFAPPAPFDHKSKRDKYEWRSGSSFKSFNKERYANSKVSRNPWKPVKRYSKKRTFSGQRPWGNIPERKPGKLNNMRLHDQRFKQWVGRGDSLKRNNYPMNEPDFMTSRLMYPGSYRRGYMPGGYVPFVANSPAFYGLYPGGFSPYSGINSSPWNW